MKHGSVLQSNQGIIGTLVSGMSLHLWYLPFVFTMLLVVDAAKRILRPVYLGVVFAALSVADLVFFQSWYPVIIAQGVPIERFAVSFAVVAFIRKYVPRLRDYAF